mgnify:CR=1 FL=1
MEITSTVKEEDLTPQELQIRNARYNPYRDLMFDYFTKAKAPKTVDQYLAAFERAKTWAKGMKVSVLPMHVDDLMTYLIHVSENVESFAAVKMARYGLAYVHQMAGYPDPTKDPGVTLIIEAARRMWAHPVKKAKPMTLYIIKMLVDKILGYDMIRSKDSFKVSIVEWRTVINIVIKFCFVARNADVLELTRQHFTFIKDLLYIHFPKSKNDQYFEGSTTMFESAKDKRYCPVYLTSKYFERLGYEPSSTGYFLPKVIMKKVDKMSNKNVFVASPKEHVSYNMCLQDRRKLLLRMGLPAKDFTEHSDRVGGVSHLFNNGGTVEEAQAQGRWKTTETPKKYIQKSESKEREISRRFFKND